MKWTVSKQVLGLQHLEIGFLQEARNSVRLLVTLMIALLVAGVPSGVVHSDPGLPLPRMPICGDQDSASPPLTLGCADFVPLLDVQLYEVPGAAPTNLVFDFVYREATYNNELGFFLVDDVSGQVAGLKPGDAGYLAAALAQATIVFPSGSNAYTSDVTLSLNGGDILVFFIIQDNTLGSFLANNPGNDASGSPVAFFSIDVVNPDVTDHFIGFRNTTDSYSQFGFEDMTGGGDADFDDVVYTIKPPLDPSLIDSDGDALPDDWEVNGLDTDLDGVSDLDLQALGADPDVQDIFVRIDWLEKSGEGGHSHKPSEDALQMVKDAFAAQGITLHIELGTAIEETRDLEVLMSTLDWDLPYTVDVRLVTDEFAALRDQYLLDNGTRPGMGSVFHYAVFGHYITKLYDKCPKLGFSRPSGIALRGTSDLVVAPQPVVDEGGEVTPFLEASVFMHELGHTLGLGHGGITPSGESDTMNFKPNHLSIMNYAFVREGLIYQGEPGLLDYSRFGPESLPTLYEDHGLTESAGLGGNSAIAGYGTRWYCSLDDTDGQTVDDASGPIDWNCDGVPLGLAVQANINKDTNNVVFDCTEQYRELVPRKEWGNLRFRNGTIGTLVTVLPEYPSQLILEDPEPDLPAEVLLGLRSIYLPLVSHEDGR